jgi:hypothetical protein
MIDSCQACILQRFLDAVHVPAFVSMSTFRFFTCTIPRTSALAFAFMWARLGKKGFWMVQKPCKAPLM